VEGTRRWLEIESNAKSSGAVAQPMRSPNSYEKLAQITAPVLVIAGGADLIAPPAMMRLWAARLSDHEFEVLVEIGHSVAFEAPDLFNELVLGFLERH
jgi:pimeloyl-ACP methyl ester carboxylesterase